MVVLIPEKPNPTRAEIDEYIEQSRWSKSLYDIQKTRREIECKSAVGALLHPAEEYFFRQTTGGFEH
jgi:hypothetical protein